MRWHGNREKFLLENGWERVEHVVSKSGRFLTMWKDPLHTLKDGVMVRRVRWPHDAENVQDRRIRLVRQIMET